MIPVSHPSPTTVTVNREHTYRRGDYLEKAGRFLTRPATLFLTTGLQLIRDIKPGIGNQAETYRKELRNRVKYFFQAAGLLIFNIAVSPALATGAVLRTIATMRYRKDAVLLQPEKDDLTHLADQPLLREINVGTFNIAAMPSFIAVRNNMSQMPERQEQMARTLSGIQKDVVCLQEAFEGFPEVAQKVRKDFPYVLYDVGRNTLSKLGSGLGLMSKYPILDFEYWEHAHAVGMETHSRKGALGATIQLPNGEFLILFNIHLHGGGRSSPEYPFGGRSYRTAQLEDFKGNILKYLERFQKNFPGKEPIVLGAGDLNIGPTRPNREGPFADTEWLSKNVPLPWDKNNTFPTKNQPSVLTEIMGDYYDTITAKQLEISTEEAASILHDPQTKSKTILGIKAKEIAPDDYPQQFSSIDKDGSKDNSVQKGIKAEFVDHIFAINEELTKQVLKTKRVRQVPIEIDQEAAIVSDHAPAYSTFTVAGSESDLEDSLFSRPASPSEGGDLYESKDHEPITIQDL